jgi:hypothetical protein
MYSHARKDRSGAALQDMLMAHAGACISAEHPAPHVDQLKELLPATGLDSILPLRVLITVEIMVVSSRGPSTTKKTRPFGRRIGATTFDHGYGHPFSRQKTTARIQWLFTYDGEMFHPASRTMILPNATFRINTIFVCWITTLQELVQARCSNNSLSSFIPNRNPLNP